MPAKFDFTDLVVLESLGKYGPRNISRVARKLGIKAETLRKRLSRMPHHFFFRFRANVYCTNLGLKKAVVLLETLPGREDLLLECLQINDFWIYLTRCYGTNEGCIAVYVIPSDHSTEFLQFINTLEIMGLTRNVRTYWSTCFQGVNSKTKWFSKRSKTWVFSWDKWVEEIPLQDTQLPRTLVDPTDYPVEGDEIDVFILKELEKNPRISLKEIAAGLGVSPQVVDYHYRKHVLERNLIEGFEVLTFHFDLSVSDMFVFTFTFDSLEKCNRFAMSLLDKPFVGGLGKIVNENSLIVDIYLPRVEFRNFVDVLSRLVRQGLLLDYSYEILDLRKAKHQTIPYEHFDSGKWIYDHNKHIKNLREHEIFKQIVVPTHLHKSP